MWCTSPRRSSDSSISSLATSRLGELVSREQLREVNALARGAFVEFDLGLQPPYHHFRAAPDDHAERPRLLVTVPRRGYRFEGPVETFSCPQVLAVPALSSTSGHDPGDETLADGMADAVTTGLAGSPHLRVLPRQSVLHQKGCERSLGAIGGSSAPTR